MQIIGWHNLNEQQNINKHQTISRLKGLQRQVEEPGGVPTGPRFGQAYQWVSTSWQRRCPAKAPWIILDPLERSWWGLGANKCQGRGVFLMYIEWAPIFWKASDTSWFFLCTVFFGSWVVYEFFILTLFVRCENYLEMPIFRRRYFWTLGSIWVSLGSTLWTLTWKSATIQRCGRHDRMFDRTSFFFFPSLLQQTCLGLSEYIQYIYIYIICIPKSIGWSSFFQSKWPLGG